MMLTLLHEEATHLVPAEELPQWKRLVAVVVGPVKAEVDVVMVGAAEDVVEAVEEDLDGAVVVVTVVAVEYGPKMGLFS